MKYKAKRTAQTWQRPTRSGPAGSLRQGDEVSVDWFWPVTDLGKITQGNHTGHYVNRNDLEEIVEVPEPEPPVDGERMEQFDKDGQLIRIWIPKS